MTLPNVAPVYTQAASIVYLQDDLFAVSWSEGTHPNIAVKLRLVRLRWRDTMDAHYDQVMNAREKIAGTGTRNYFAYSTILDRAAFLEWRAQHEYEFFDLPQGRLAEAIDIDLVYDFPSRWWGGRVAGLVDRPGASVHGLLFAIAEKDWPIVMHKEGAVTGMCVERALMVRVGGETIQATAFTTNPARARQDGPISDRFVEALVSGATSAGLPAEYIASLRGRAR